MPKWRRDAKLVVVCCWWRWVWVLTGERGWCCSLCSLERAESISWWRSSRCVARSGWGDLQPRVGLVVLGGWFWVGGDAVVGIDRRVRLAGAGDADARGDQVHESELHGVQVPPDQGPPVAQGMVGCGVCVGVVCLRDGVFGVAVPVRVLWGEGLGGVEAWG